MGEENKKKKDSMEGICLLDMSNNSREEWLESDDEVFEDSGFYGTKLRILVKIPAKVEMNRISNKHMKYKQGIPRYKFEEISVETFIKCVIEWQGLADKKTGKPLECDIANKRDIALGLNSFLAEAVAEFIDRKRKEIESHRQEQVKN